MRARAGVASRGSTDAPSGKKPRAGDAREAPPRRGSGRRRTAGAAAGTTDALTPSERRARLIQGWKASLEGLRPQLVRDGEVQVLAVQLGRSQRPLLVTCGLAERGFELGMSVEPGSSDAPLPPWAADTMTSLANASREQAELSVTQLLTLGTGRSELAHFAFTSLPGFPPVSTPAGRVEALLAVGLTADEARLIREWSPQGFLEVLAQATGGLATDPERPSLLQSPRARTLIEGRVEREGSSLQAMRAGSSAVERRGTVAVWTLSADAVDTLVCLLKGRIGHQRPFTVSPLQGIPVDVVPSDRGSLELHDGGRRAVLGLSLTAARQLRASLRPRKGQYTADAMPLVVIEVT